LHIGNNAFHLIAEIKPHVESNLVVAAPRRVQFAAGGADDLGQTPLDIHVNVFVRLRELEFSTVDLKLHSLQAADDFLCITRRNDVLLGEHLGVSDAASDIVAIEPRIDVDGCGKSLDRGRRSACKAAAPKLVFSCFRITQSDAVFGFLYSDVQN